MGEHRQARRRRWRMVLVKSFTLLVWMVIAAAVILMVLNWN